MNRTLFAGMLALLAPLSACSADGLGPDTASPDENIGSVELPVVSGHYTSSLRSSGYPQGVCGYESSGSTVNDHELNDNNSPYSLKWVTNDKMCFTIQWKGTPCSNADGFPSGEIDYTARCNSMITDMRKINMPILWSSSQCLTADQQSVLNSSGDLVQLGNVNATWSGHSTPLAVGAWKIFRHDSSTTAKYQYDILANGGSTSSFLNVIKAADPSKTDLNGVMLCLEDSGIHQMPAGYDAADCVGFQQSESLSWYPTYLPYGFYDVSDHHWCPVSYSVRP